MSVPLKALIEEQVGTALAVCQVWVFGVMLNIALSYVVPQLRAAPDIISPKLGS